MSKQIVRCKLCGARMRGGGEYIYFCPKCKVYRDPDGSQWKWSHYRTQGLLSNTRWEPIADKLSDIWNEAIERLDMGDDF